MTVRRKKAIGALAVILVLIGFAGVTFLSSPGSPPLDVAFLDYTNPAPGGLSATLEIRNCTQDRIARNSCRISPQPADAGYWYVADVPSHRLDAGETERLVVTFEPRPMTRWRATILYVRNPTDLERRFMSVVDYLSRHRLAPSTLLQRRNQLAGGQVSTEWIVLPATNRAPDSR